MADEATVHRVGRAGAPDTLAARELRSAEVEAHTDRASAAEPAATIVGPGDALLPALAGARGEGLFAPGDQRAPGSIAQWLDRAQSA